MSALFCFAPSRVQDVLRVFAPRADRPVPVSLAYVAAPVYVQWQGRRHAFATDGVAGIWTAAACPGFREYEAAVPGCVAARDFTGLWQPGAGLGPGGFAGKGRVWSMELAGVPARLRAGDVRRLLLLDSCDVWGGSRDGVGAVWRTDSGWPLGWEFVCFAGAFGAARFFGVVRCQRPAVLGRARV
jgi:hypothetical protein